jgi:hypothetical protein
MSVGAAFAQFRTLHEQIPELHLPLEWEANP